LPVLLKIGRCNQPVTVDTFALVHPQLDQGVSLFNSLGLGGKEPLKDVGEMAHVELVVEVGRGLAELH